MIPTICDSHHYNDIIMGTMASQITSLTIVYSTVYSGADQRKHQSSASLAFVWRIHRGPMNSPHKWPVTRKMFPFDDVIMWRCHDMYAFFALLVKRVNHSPAIPSQKGPQCRALISALLLAWESCWTNNAIDDYLRCFGQHHNDTHNLLHLMHTLSFYSIWIII